MVYITTKRAPVYHQMTLDDLLNDAVSADDFGYSQNSTSTYTYTVERPRNGMLKMDRLLELIDSLERFNTYAQRLHCVADRRTLFQTFYLAKRSKGMPYFVRSLFKTQGRYVQCDYKQAFRDLALAIHPLLEQHETTEQETIFASCEDGVKAVLTRLGFDLSKVDFGEALKGAFRRIDVPKPALQSALGSLKRIFEEDFKALYHTSAYAYVPGRCTIDSRRRHQKNDSHWFGYLDLSNFFNSTTIDFVMKMLPMIFPFSEVIATPAGKEALEKAVSLAFLNGGLPQGTEISPLLTNIMMIPIDHALANKLHWYKNQSYVYTRYADDFEISSQYGFNIREIEKVIKDVLASFGAPFTVNETKTSYGSRAGSNWHLGVMLNKDNNITVGYKNIRAFKTKLFQFVMDAQSGNPWSLSEVKKLDGLRSYYTMVEGETISKIVDHMSKTTGVDIPATIRQALRA